MRKRSERYSVTVSQVMVATVKHDRCDKHEVDDEIIFFNHCIHFLEARKTLFDLINQSNVNFQSLSSFQKIFWTFNCENIDILNNLSIFLLESGVT